MSFAELVKAFWVWWVTEGGMTPYKQELFVSRGFQLALVIAVFVFAIAFIFSKDLRKKFW